MIRSTATVDGANVSDGYLIRIVNDPATGQVEGRVAVFSNAFGHGASGFMHFHDAAGSLLFSRQVWSHSANYALVGVPPGQYKLRFEADSGGLGWYPNADSNTAETVTIAAGATVPDINFTFGSGPVTPDPEIVGAPGQTPGGGFGFSVQSEFDKGYQFRKSTTLRDGSWFVLGSFWGDGSVVDLEDTNTASHAFYRVVPE